MRPRPAGATPPNRRRFPRVQVLGLVEGRLVPQEMPLDIRELGEGGFSLQGASPFPPGSQYHFRFTAPGHDEVILAATAVHCRLTEADARGRVTFVTGFEFASTPQTDQAVGVLIDTLTSVLSAD